MPTFSGDLPALSPEDLPRFHFFDDDRAVRYYQASPRPIQNFGHPRIVAAIKSVSADASPSVPIPRVMLTLWRSFAFLRTAQPMCFLSPNAITSSATNALEPR